MAKENNYEKEIFKNNMAKHWLTYWKGDTAKRDCGITIDHTASEQLFKVEKGDTLWIFTYFGGATYLVGYLTVAKIVDQDTAERILRADNLWEATYHAIAAPRKKS